MLCQQVNGRLPKRKHGGRGRSDWVSSLNGRFPIGGFAASFAETSIVGVALGSGGHRRHPHIVFRLLSVVARNNSPVVFVNPEREGKKGEFATHIAAEALMITTFPGKRGGIAMTTA